MCHNRYIEYTLMYIGYECIGCECVGYECVNRYIEYTLMYIGYVEYNEYSFMYFITLPLEYSLYS